PSLSRRDGCGVHRRDCRHLAGQCRDEDPSRQEDTRATFSRGHTMTDSRPEGTLQALWQSQPRGEHAMSVEEVREGARRLERRVARRNRREYIAAVVVVIGYGWILWRIPFATARIGAGL